jgi:hypothetical protein
MANDTVRGTTPAASVTAAGLRTRPWMTPACRCACAAPEGLQPPGAPGGGR